MIMNAYVENGVCFFDIFLVDVGEQQLRTTMKDMFPMRYGFVKRLPFQAIGFELAHIRPKDSTSGVWDEATIDKVINLTVDEDGNATCLEVVVSYRLLLIISHVLSVKKLNGSEFYFISGFRIKKAPSFRMSLLQGYDVFRQRQRTWRGHGR